MKTYLIGNFISLFLPTSFGGDVYRIYVLRKFNLDVFRNASSVLFDRLTGLFALASISVLSFFLFYRDIIDYRFILIFFVTVFLFWISASDKMISLLDTIKYKIVKPIVTILDSFKKYKNNRTLLIKTLIISFVFQNNIIWIVKLYCVALNIDIDLKYLYMFVPLIYLTEVLPISINGLGVREAAFVFFFNMLGRPSEEAIAVSLLVITMRYLFTTAVGGSIFLFTLLRIPKQSAPPQTLPTAERLEPDDTPRIA
jgi:uncharacterized protein (TIRG00374 family)